MPVIRFGLIAHRLHRQGSDSSLLRWLQAAEPAVRALNLGLHAVGGTYDAVERYGLLAKFPGLVRYPNGHAGGLTRLVSHIVGGVQPGQALDGVVFLIDPVDPSSVFPEAQALKRQCVIHGKPFMATEAAALEWLKVESLHAGLEGAQAPGVALLQAMPGQVVALIAHDALKTRMV
ncbi:MAG: methylglyoxal synthase, partial [Ferruginibacter sp.]|nr:methylglyoxal synthase [Rhodoferax sp.]